MTHHATNGCESPIPITIAGVMAELASLAQKNVYARACLREFLNTRPILGAVALEGDHGPASGTLHQIADDEPSEGLRSCLAACRAVAFDENRDGFFGAESHDGDPSCGANCVTPAMIEAGAACLDHDVAIDLAQGFVRSREIVETVFRAMLKAASSTLEDRKGK